MVSYYFYYLILHENKIIQNIKSVHYETIKRENNIGSK